jgi:putative transposase
MNISERTLKRWRDSDGQVAEDQRPEAEPVEQPHKLTRAEELAILSACNQPEYGVRHHRRSRRHSLKKGIYLASESPFYRVLKKHPQQNHRGRMKPPREVPEPTSFTATGPNQVWSWDISYCPSAVRSQHWYLYLIIDIYSRKIIAWEVHEAESDELARKLVERALLREGCWHNPPVLHSDNGAPMTLIGAKPDWLSWAC